jgi:predicted transcriptional regulator
LSEKIDEHKTQELKEMIQERKTNEPVEEVLAIFCERHGIALDACRILYNRLVDKGEIKEK